MPLFALVLIVCGSFLLTCCLFIRLCLVVVIVRGQSMSPTLDPGDRVLALRIFARSWIRKGQIVLVRQADGGHLPEMISVLSHIKRVVALGEETFISASGEQDWHIPPGYIFVCGDNQKHSIDSRTWGPV